MKDYKVRISATLTIEAETEDEAVLKAKDKWADLSHDRIADSFDYEVVGERGGPSIGLPAMKD